MVTHAVLYLGVALHAAADGHLPGFGADAEEAWRRVVADDAVAHLAELLLYKARHARVIQHRTATRVHWQDERTVQQSTARVARARIARRLPVGRHRRRALE